MTSKEKLLCTDIIESSLALSVQTRDAFLHLKRKVASKHRQKIPSTATLRKIYLDIVDHTPEKQSPVLEKILIKRAVRSLSGVAIITVLTKPYACPGKCVYCPTEAIMPKSYLSNEPAAMRALVNEFDPWRQVETRLRSLTENGHPSDKVELIVKGGTWSAYPWQYRKWFIKRCFDACNSFGGDRGRTTTLRAAQDVNENTKHRIIGLTLETRPDWINPDEIVRLRELGCTRIELGVQSVNDKMLEITKRGHDVASVIRAARLLKDAGCKTDFHMMPQLPDATPKSDLAELQKIFSNPNFRPDMIKIYPCVVIELAELYSWWKEKKYIPYPDEALIDMLIKAKQAVPRYCRISRLIRDIPSTSIVAGNALTNLREVVQDRMRKLGVHCDCLRCREIGHSAKENPKLATATPILFDDEYEASGGIEHFLSFEDAKRRAVFGFCRLRLPNKNPTDPEVKKIWQKIPEIRGAAFLRELHTYGSLVPIDEQNPDASQHKGLGKKLMLEAERLARSAGYKKMAVISGIGVREYYRKLGYKRQGTYMVKKLK